VNSSLDGGCCRGWARFAAVRAGQILGVCGVWAVGCPSYCLRCSGFCLLSGSISRTNPRIIAELNHVLQNLGVMGEGRYEELFFNHRSVPDENSDTELENHLITTDVKRRIDRLERTLATYGLAGQGTS